MVNFGNIVQYGGVIGAFNCQGAGWDPKEQRIKGYSECYKPLTGSVHVSNLEWDQKPEAVSLGESEEYAVYLTEAEKIVVTTPESDPISVTLQPSTFEIFSFVPIKKIGAGAKFAPIGLTNMFNAGGSIQGLVYDESVAKVEVKGDGTFLAYSSVAPKKTYVNGAEEVFQWSGNGKVQVSIGWYEECGGISNVTFVY